MPKFLASIAALTLIGAATLPLQANAAERHNGISKAQSTELSSQYWRRHYRYGYYGPRRYWGPRYGYHRYGYPYRYGYGYGYGYPYGYYRPGFALGVGPFGFRIF
jgi:hypothetical protein